MTTEQIESILKSYKSSLGRCNHLKVRMTTIERQIEIEKQDITETLASPKPRVLSDMPRGTQIGNPTEKYGSMLADGYKSDELIRLETELAEIQSEYDEKIVSVNYVNSWLSGLSERERVVIRSNVINDESWKDTVSTYNQRFGDSVSKDTLKRIKVKAMDKISEMAK